MLPQSALRHRVAGLWAVVIGCVVMGLPTTLPAQMTTEMAVGIYDEAWQQWKAASDAVDRQRMDEANALFEKVAEHKLSPLRLALMADETGTQRIDKAIKDGELAQVAQDLMAEIAIGRRRRELAEDGWHFAQIGRFQLANQYFEALLKEDPDPVALLELSERDKRRFEVLVMLVNNTEVGPAAKRLLERINEGERIIRTDPQRIRRNIELLGGTARQKRNAMERLKQSGEHAIPYLVEALMDPEHETIHVQIYETLPFIGKEAVGPLVMALRSEDNVAREFIVKALGQIGYPQALPYLHAMKRDQTVNKRLLGVVTQAISMIERNAPGMAGKSTAEMFLNLAANYYYDHESLRADITQANANVWYWDAERRLITNIVVPTDIFNEVMAMRCAEEALALDAKVAGAVELWLAANFHREAQLGVQDVASGEADPATQADKTKPADYPRAIYFARAAGPRYNHNVLARAVKDYDSAVALGAIAALRATAGASSLIGTEDYKQPLVKTLSFPNLVVRIRAALALAHALPRTEFLGSQNVITVLGEALAQTGQKNAVVVEPDQQNLNRIQAILRDQDFKVVAEQTFLEALKRARKELPSVDVIYIASDVKDANVPDLGAAIHQLRKEFAFAATPVVILAKPQQTFLAMQLSRLDPSVGRVLAEADTERLLREWQTVARDVGHAELTSDLALALALEAAEALRMIAVSNSPVYDFKRAETALVGALGHPSNELKVTAASVLALAPSSVAQQAIARLALDPDMEEAVRIAAYGSLAESARTFGSKLTNKLVDQVIAEAMTQEALPIRTAASQALGALNLAADKASQIIQAQHKG